MARRRRASSEDSEVVELDSSCDSSELYDSDCSCSDCKACDDRSSDSDSSEDDFEYNEKATLKQQGKRFIKRYNSRSRSRPGRNHKVVTFHPQVRAFPGTHPLVYQNYSPPPPPSLSYLGSYSPPPQLQQTHRIDNQISAGEKSQVNKEKSKKGAQISKDVEINTENTKKGSSLYDLANQVRNSIKFIGNLFSSSSSNDSVPPLLVFDRNQMENAVLRLRSHYDGKVVHVLSFNILADEFTHSPRDPHMYKHVPKQALAWPYRLKLLTHQLTESAADIVCLQEVSRNAFEVSLLPLMEALGYSGKLQCSTIKFTEEQMQKFKGKSKKASKELPGLATFYKTNVFEEVKVVKSFRAMILLLKLKFTSNKNKIFCCVNLHLEGNPDKSEEREKQLQAAFRKVQGLVPDYVCFCGDFNSNFLKKDPNRDNAELTELVTSRYLRDSYSAKESDHHLAGKYDFRDNTCLLSPREGKNWKEYDQGQSMVDHILYDPLSLEVVGLSKIFNSSWNRDEMIDLGLPSISWPSDHLSLSVVFRLKDVTAAQDSAPKKKVRSEVDIINDIKHSMTSEQFGEWNRIVEDEKKTDSIKSTTGTLSQEEVQNIKDRSKLKKDLISKLSKEAEGFVREYNKFRKAENKSKKLR